MTYRVEEILRLIDHSTKEEDEQIRAAFLFAENAHKDQKRNSGEPYFSHVFETAKILAELGMGASTVIAGLLHDAVEDVNVSIDEIKEKFGNEIAFIVDGVTKLGQVRYRGADKHNESLRKLFVATSEDMRVLLVKLADRLHNMRTLKHVSLEKQKRIATETLEIYAPVAYRLGIRKLSRELEDLSFPYVYPEEYAVMKKELSEKRFSTEGLEKFLKSIKKALAREGLTHIKTDFRVKGTYSLYKKIAAKDKNLENIYDLAAVRILVDKPEECYHVLGIVHKEWRPLPRRIKDYIAFPKPNGYRALHTTVFTGEGDVVEVQIKTYAMHRHAEYGFASHISYKGGKSADAQTLEWVQSLLTSRKDSNVPLKSTDTPTWIRELVEYHNDTEDNEIFKKGLQKDFFNVRIFVFSPKGDVVDLPITSTPLDFAYAIHSDIGNHMTGAKVNGKLASLDTKLKNGDIVEIMTRQNAAPSRKWLEYTRTSTARRHILRFLAKQKKSRQ